MFDLMMMKWLPTSHWWLEDSTWMMKMLPGVLHLLLELHVYQSLESPNVTRKPNWQCIILKSM